MHVYFLMQFYIYELILQTHTRKVFSTNKILDIFTIIGQEKTYIG